MAVRVVELVVTAAIVLSSGGIASAAPRYSDWSTPVNLGSIINSSSDDTGPALSKDGLSFYFTSTRTGFGAEDIWVSQRANGLTVGSAGESRGCDQHRRQRACAELLARRSLDVLR